MRKLTLVAAAALAAVTAVLAATGVAGARPAAPQKTLTIGISHYAGVIPFYRAMETGFEAGARKYGMKVITTDSMFDPSKQVATPTITATAGPARIAANVMPMESRKIGSLMR